MKYQSLFSLFAVISITLVCIKATENNYINATSQCAIKTNNEYNALINFYQNGPNSLLFIKGVLNAKLLIPNYGDKIEKNPFIIRVHDKISNSLCENNICNCMSKVFNPKNSNNRSDGDIGLITLNRNYEFYLYDGYSSLYGTNDNIIGKICVLYQKSLNNEEVIECGIINSGITKELNIVNTSISKSLIFIPIFVLTIIFL